jgi:hypothetical protein
VAHLGLAQAVRLREDQSHCGSQWRDTGGAPVWGLLPNVVHIGSYPGLDSRAGGGAWLAERKPEARPGLHIPRLKCSGEEGAYCGGPPL